MIRRTLMNKTKLDEWLMDLNVACIYMHVAEPEDYWESSVHVHDYNEICYVAQGRGTYVIEDIEYSMSLGDLFFLPKGTRHGEVCNKEDAYELRFVMVENSGEAADEINALFFAKAARIRCGQYQQVRRLWDQILDEVIGHEDGYLAIVESCLKVLYAVLYREIYAEMTPAQSLHYSSHSQIKKREFLSMRVRSYVMENINRTIGANELAEVFHYHPKYLTRLIKQETGKTLTAFVQSIRLGCACELLAKTQHSIANVLMLCGFNNDAHFFRSFKQEFGVTPAQYRRKKQNAPKDEVKQL